MKGWRPTQNKSHEKTIRQDEKREMLALRRETEKEQEEKEQKIQTMRNVQMDRVREKGWIEGQRMRWREGVLLI